MDMLYVTMFCDFGFPFSFFRNFSLKSWFFWIIIALKHFHWFSRSDPLEPSIFSYYICAPPVARRFQYFSLIPFLWAPYGYALCHYILRFSFFAFIFSEFQFEIMIFLNYYSAEAFYWFSRSDPLEPSMIC